MQTTERGKRCTLVCPNDAATPANPNRRRRELGPGVCACTLARDSETAWYKERGRKPPGQVIDATLAACWGARGQADLSTPPSGSDAPPNTGAAMSAEGGDVAVDPLSPKHRWCGSRQRTTGGGHAGTARAALLSSSPISFSSRRTLDPGDVRAGGELGGG